MPRSIITLTTDFGPSSPYIGQLKGVVLSIHRDVELVDFSHAVPPQQILAGAVMLVDGYHHFPSGTIHVAVVDPEVGTDRAMILAEIDGHFFVAPDNGLLGLVAQRRRPSRIVRLETRAFWREPISQTFHGRDIMAPVAAHLARGVDFAEFGPAQSDVYPLDLPAPVVETNLAEGTVLAIDSFGNVVTNLDPAMLPPDISRLTLRIDGLPAHDVPVVATYAEGPENRIISLVGSSGRIEIAVANGNANERLGVGVGRRVGLEWS